MRKTIFSLIIGKLFFLPLMSYAQTVEFNEQALFVSGMGHVDLSAFEKSSYSEGKFLVDVFVNGHKVNYLDQIDFLKREDNIEACLPPKLIESIGLKSSFFEGAPVWNDGNCVDLKSIDEHIQIRFDDEKQELHLSIPQLHFLYNDASWVPPQQRDSGINGLVIDYSVIGNYANFKNDSASHNLNSYGTVGANVGTWRLRSNYQYQNTFGQENGASNFEWVQTYAFTDLPSWSSKLFVGEHYTSSNLFDSVRFVGVSVFSDENMLPAALRGYAPNISGIASSNAVVTISQNGRILSQTQVPPGPFSIDNLSSSLSGTLDVRITEEDGRVREYQVSTTSIPFLTRQGQVRYTVNAGQLAPLGGEDVNSDFLSGEFSWGVLNNASVFGGIFSTADRKYYAYNVGLGVNMEKLGALSFDVTNSVNSVESTEKQEGSSYRLNYAMRFSDTSRLNLVGYRFSSKSFMSVNDYIIAQSGLLNSWDREKNIFSMSFSQQLPAWNANVSFNASRGTYWNGNDTKNYSFTFNKTLNWSFLKDALLTMSLGRNTDARGGHFSQAYLSLSVPLAGRSSGRLQYFGAYSGQSKTYTNNVGYYDTWRGNNVGLSVASMDAGRNIGLGASLYRETPYGTIQLNGAYNEDYQSLAGGVDGSITITSHGIVAHPRVFQNQARLIVDTDGAAGVYINDNQAITNSQGLAGISNVPAYYRNFQYINLNNMPQNVEVSNNVIETVLTDGAIGYAQVQAIIGEKILTTILMSDGTFPPFGAFVYDADNSRELGMVSDQGYTYLAGVQAGKVIVVKWGNEQSCRISIGQADVQGLQTLICQVDA